MRLIQHHSFQEVLANMSLINEENRYYNWYHGLSDIILPYWGEGIDCTNSWCKEVSLKYPIRTRAPSGVISTKYFGEKFDLEKIGKDILNTVVFHYHEEMRNENFTNYVNIEDNIIMRMDKIIVNNDEYGFRKNYYGNEQAPIENFSFSRKISKSKIDDLKMDMMPGFSLSWNSSGRDNLFMSYTNSTSVFKRWVCLPQYSL